MILITGAMGKLGSAVVDRLSVIANKDEFILMTTNLSKAKKYIDDGYIVREGNFDDKESLIKAFKGVKKLLMISTMSFNRYDQQRNAIDAAKENNIEHMIYTSLSIKDIGISNVSNIMGSHYQTEDYLIESGMKYTILRNTMYADALLDIVGDLNTVQSIELPAGSGEVPFALRQEMGEATANLLIQDGHENKIYDITGDEMYSFSNIAESLSLIKNEKIKYIDIKPNTYLDRLKTYNLPEFMIDFTLGTVLDVRDKQYQIHSTQLSSLLNRPTKKINEILSELMKGN